VIEARNADGTLDLKCAQPEMMFGDKAITGITCDDMAKVIFHHCPNASLHGTNIPIWPKALHEKWIARVKYW
jgi:hypothetical protein